MEDAMMQSSANVNVPADVPPSNAGLYDRNPGSESLALSYTRSFRPRR